MDIRIVIGMFAFFIAGYILGRIVTNKSNVNKIPKDIKKIEIVEQDAHVTIKKPDIVIQEDKKEDVETEENESEEKTEPVQND
jgi:hypothetical protein